MKNINPKFIENAKQLVKRSNLPTTQKSLWLEKIPYLPLILLNRLVTHLQRLEILNIEKDFIKAYTSLPPEKVFDENEQRKALAKLNEINQRKEDLRKIQEIQEKIFEHYISSP